MSKGLSETVYYIIDIRNIFGKECAIAVEVRREDVPRLRALAVKIRNALSKTKTDGGIKELQSEYIQLLYGHIPPDQNSSATIRSNFYSSKEVYFPTAGKKWKLYGTAEKESVKTNKMPLII